MAFQAIEGDFFNFESPVIKITGSDAARHSESQGVCLYFEHDNLGQ